MFKKLLLAGAAALALCVAVPVAQATEWHAVAINDQGWGYSGAGYDDEEDARYAAIDACESETGYSCGWMTTSVPYEWYLVAAYCPNGAPVSGGSKHNFSVANHNAAVKAGYNSCRRVVLER